MLFSINENLYAQSSLYKSVSEITKSKESGQNQLSQLYSLKKRAEENHQTNDSGYAVILFNIALYECYRQNYPLAFSLASEALQNAKRQPSAKSLLLKSHYSLATCFFYTSQYDRAVRHYDTVIELGSKYDPGSYLLNALYYRTYIDVELGDYSRAVDVCKLGMNEAFVKKDTAFYNDFLYYSAYALTIQDQLAVATRQADQCILLSRKTNDSEHLANAYEIKAHIYTKEKNYLPAEDYYKKAISYRAEVPSEYSALSIDYNDLGVFYLQELHDYKKADACFRRATQYSKQSRIEERPRKLFLSYSNTGDLYASLQQPFKAIQYYNRALNCVNADVRDFLNLNPALKQLNPIWNKEAVLSILSSKCTLLLSLYKTTSKKEYLQNCIHTSVLADSLITQMRHEQLGEKSKLYWRNKTRGLFSNALEACYTTGNTDSAFYFMERSRSVLLSDKLNELTSSASYLPKADADRETDLQRKILGLEKELEPLPASSPRYSTTEATLLQAREEQDRFIKSLEKNNPRYYQFKYEDDIPSLATLKNNLKKNHQNFVYYFISDSAIYALGISGNETHFIKVPPAAISGRDLSDFIRLCSDKQAINSHYERYSSLAQAIYKNLFQPLRIPPGKTAICTDNFFIPFEALCTDNKGKHFLLNDYSFSYVYSARSLLKPFVGNEKPAGDFAGFAPVSFSSALGVYPLTNSSEALETSGSYYHNHTLFTQQQASKYNFLSQASKYSIVTIFSHAQADTTDKEPVLYMQDSLIPLSELQMLSNSAIRFVLLSACQTNIGRNATGEGIYSLARGFAAAGVPAVSATLWKADEGAVYSISGKFNECLSKGMDKSEALQQAKLWYLKNSDREQALPYYWANLVMIGSSEPIVFAQPEKHNPLWVIISLLTVLSLLAFIFIYKYWGKRKRISSSEKD